MEDYEEYEKMPFPELERQVRQGNKHALFEMAFRLDKLMPDVKDPVEKTAWRNIWLEKAAKAGHIDAKSRIARNYYLISYEGVVEKFCQKAVKYYQELSNDLDSGKLDDQEIGNMAKLMLGKLLCEGNGTPRDEENGMKLVKEAENYFEDFKDFGFIPLCALGEMYGQGYAQTDEVPTSDDLKKAIWYLKAAIEASKVQKVDQGQKEHVEEYLEWAEKQFEGKKREEEGLADLFDSLMQEKKKEEEGLPNFFDFVKKEYETLLKKSAILNHERINNRRKELMELSDEKKQKISTYEAALEQFRKLLASNGW